MSVQTKPSPRKRAFRVVAILTLIMAALYGCYAVTFPSATIRYRMTVTVDTPDGARVASAVHQVWRQDTSEALGNFGGTGIAFKAEAVIVDLGSRGVLFVTYQPIKDTGNGEYVVAGFSQMAAGIGVDTMDRRAFIREISRKAAMDLPPVVVPLRAYPLMVRFRDLKNPLSVEAVDPTNLATSFGDGVALSGISVEVTQDPLNSVILRWLPWLPEYRGKGGFDGQKDHVFNANNPLANRLRTGSFSNIYTR